MYACSHCIQVYKKMFNCAKMHLKHTESFMPHSKLPSLKYIYFCLPGFEIAPSYDITVFLNMPLNMQIKEVLS